MPTMMLVLVVCATAAAIWVYDSTARETVMLVNTIEDRTLTRWITIHLERGRDEPTPEEDHARIHDWIYERRHKIDQQGYEITCQQIMDEFPEAVQVDVAHGGQHVGCSLRRNPWT